MTLNVNPTDTRRSHSFSFALTSPGVPSREVNLLHHRRLECQEGFSGNSVPAEELRGGDGKFAIGEFDNGTGTATPVELKSGGMPALAD